MPRPRRVVPGGLPFHVLNRAVGRRTIFESNADYNVFLNVIAETLRTKPMRICGYCVMPNHWHLVLWPEHDGDLSAFVQHLTNLHVKRWKKAHQEVGLGHLYQGRFKSFPISNDAYFQTVIRYVERNPLRAKLIARAEDWRWSSLGQHSPSDPIPLGPWPVAQALDRQSTAWIDWVNTPQTEGELQSVRESAIRGRPFGNDAWVQGVAAALKLDATLRKRGRPRSATRRACGY